MTKDKLSESEIKLLEDMANNVRLMPRENRDAIKHALKMVRSEDKTEEEPKPKPKFKLGDKVEIDNLLSAYDGKVGTIAQTLIGEAVNNGVKIQNDIIAFNEDSLEIYTEPTADEEELAPTILTEPQLTIERAQKEKTEIGKKRKKTESRKRIDEEWRKKFAAKKNKEICCETVPTPAWQSYRMELAAKIAVAYAEKGRYEPEEIGAKAVEVANGVVERLKNGKV